MASLNKCLLIGNMTKDANLKYTPSGKAVCDFGLAVNEKYDGKDSTVFLDVTAWGKTAENICQYLSKGSPVFIEGKLQLDQWDDKETGQKRSKIRVIALNVQFLPSGEKKDKPVGADPFPNDDEEPF